MLLDNIVTVVDCMCTFFFPFSAMLLCYSLCFSTVIGELKMPTFFRVRFYQR